MLDAERAHESSERTGLANAEVIRRMSVARPRLVDVLPAGELVSNLGERDLLHAGPPLNGWQEASQVGALRGSVLGALVHLGLARDVSEAEELASADEIRFKSANDHGTGGTYAGVMGRQTPLLVVEDSETGSRAGAALNEGRGKALRYGANDAETLDRLRWLETECSEILSAAIRAAGGIDLFDILVQALHMGDDGHSRQKAASALFATAIAAPILDAGAPPKEAARVLRFLQRNDIFFLPLTMSAGKCTMQSVQGVKDASIVTCMAANGVRFGIKVSGLGDEWFTAPVPQVEGQYFEGYGAADANPVIGDSEISETMGLGAFAMPAAPALSRYVGGTPAEATRLASEMYSITVSEHPHFSIPALDYRGSPMGIDVRKVAESGLTPLFNTGIAHKEPGIGQIGAGFVRTPLGCYQAAAEKLPGGASE